MPSGTAWLAGVVAARRIVRLRPSGWPGVLRPGPVSHGQLGGLLKVAGGALTGTVVLPRRHRRQGAEPSLDQGGEPVPPARWRWVAPSTPRHGRYWMRPEPSRWPTIGGEPLMLVADGDLGQQLPVDHTAWGNTVIWGSSGGPNAQNAARKNLDDPEQTANGRCRRQLSLRRGPG